MQRRSYHLVEMNAVLPHVFRVPRVIVYRFQYAKKKFTLAIHFYFW